MRVREQDGVDAPKVVAQRLGTQVRRRIHQHTHPVVAVDAMDGTRAGVAGIGRPADVTVAANHWHAMGRPGAKERARARTTNVT
jgi:hypothetical protein